MLSNASSFSFFVIKLKKFFIGLRSGLRGGIENTSALNYFIAFKALSFALETHPAKKQLPWQCSVFLHTSGKSLRIIDANWLPSKRPRYWLNRTMLHPGDQATIKCAIQPPVPARLTLVVHERLFYKPSFL